jgi:hypothetical protein
MFDITSPKVLVPAVGFALLNLAPIHMKGVVIMALIIGIFNFIIIKYILKYNVTTADIIVPSVLLILLTPGVILTLPPGEFFSGKTGPLPLTVHTLVFAVVYASLRGTFPQYY